MYFMNKDISFSSSSKCLKISAHVDEGYLEGSVSQIFFIEILDFILCNLEKKVLKNEQKLPVF